MFGYPVGPQKEVSVLDITARRSRETFLIVFVSRSRSRRDIGSKGRSDFGHTPEPAKITV